MIFDIIIVGGGLAGASLALALKNQNLKIGLIESRPSDQSDNTGWDSRVYAISPGSAGFLQELGVWGLLDRTRMTPVYDMAVFGDDNTSHLDFGAYDCGLPELAWIIENRQLQAAAWGELESGQTRGEVTLFCPVQCIGIEWKDGGVVLQLNDNRLLEAALVVAADGIHSWVRQQAQIAVSQHRYRQIGVVANFSTERPHRHIAHQWFRRDGVLALLPLPEKRVSMVWSANEDEAERLLGLGGEALSGEVATASGNVLGRLEMITAPVAFPLGFMHAAKLVQSRLALIGDAAHGIHPLAGQGINLGLRDVRELAKTIIARGLQEDCGDYFLLRRYERARKEDILAMELATDGLQKLFNNSHPTLSRLRNLGLDMTNRLPWVKNRLMQHALD
jgi:2-polyprenylphenol 6-hydroxylase